MSGIFYDDVTPKTKVKPVLAESEAIRYATTRKTKLFTHVSAMSKTATEK